MSFFGLLDAKFFCIDIIKVKIITTRVCGKVMFSYCLCICVSVCVSVCLSVWAITFECFNIETPFLVWYNILTILRSSLSTKVIE